MTVTEGRPAGLGVPNESLHSPRASIAPQACKPGGQTLLCQNAGLARPGPRTERLSANERTASTTRARCATLDWRRCYGDMTFCDVNA